MNTKAEIKSYIRTLTVPEGELTRWKDYTHYAKLLRPLVPLEAQDWLSRTLTEHYRI